MAFVAPCPRCQRKLQVPDACEGADVRCPSCGATFPAPTPSQTQAAFGPVTASEPLTETGMPPVVESKESRAEEGIIEAAKAAVWTDGAAWHRVHSGLGWVAAGLAVGLGALFLRYLPELLHLSGVGLVERDDEISLEVEVLHRLFRRSVGLVGLCCSACMLAGLFRCLLYPVRGRGSLLAM